ncbi:MAG: hypothetical protein AABO41_08990 [Acidobacteriota bacterium]
MNYRNLVFTPVTNRVQCSDATSHFGLRGRSATSNFEILEQETFPARPKKVELDPDEWVLSEKISTKGG